MTSTQNLDRQPIQYSPQTVKRADRALRCSPFKLTLFSAMRSASVPLAAIAGQHGVQQNYTKHPLIELVAESALRWLIAVGLLRREVDGQGITDSFRLTPLGRQLVETWESQGENRAEASGCDRLKNAASRWLRLPL